MKRSGQKQKNLVYFDYSLLLIVLFLICFGLVMLYSTSSYNGQVKFGDDAYYLKKQLMADAIGIVGMAVLARIDYRIWKKFWLLAYVGAFFLCAVVLAVGDTYNGAKRWLRIGPLSFQPSEAAKLAIILFLAAVISQMPKQISKFSALAKVMAMTLPMVVIVALENLSTAIIILGIAFLMAFVASPKIAQFALIVGGCLAIAILFVIVEPYRIERFAIWMHPEQYEKGYQTLQGLYAIGSGGLFGKGLGNSMQKLGFVPEAQNDMIFSIVCEELGLFGAICVILLFVMLLWRFLVIANNAQDMYGAMIVTGAFVHIAIQVFMNIGVVTNSLPNTGVSLPFISYGGTSVLFLLAEIGIVLSVSRGIRLEE